MSPSSLTIAAIHHGELQKAPASAIVVELEPIACSVVEVSFQEPFSPGANLVELRSWRHEQATLETRWAQYLGSSRPRFLSKLGAAVFDASIIVSPSARASAWFTRQVERAVSQKHITAWREFLESGAQELLVLESDAVLTPSTVQAIDTLLNIPDPIARYVNLSGGLTADEIAVEIVPHRQWSEAHSFITYSRPVTNTSCAYLVNSAAVQNLVSYLEEYPKHALLGIDWIFNAAFMAAAPGEVTCLHAAPPVIQHGSMTGATKSWHPKR